MNFRRWITALAVLALFAGFASAQVANSGAGTGALQCAASVAVPPTLRSEGMTELVGDIVLTCSGGPTPVVGNAIATANFTVSFGTQVTSRLLTFGTLISGQTAATNTSEALLMIDEPGSGLYAGMAGNTTSAPIGPNAGQLLCGNGNLAYSTVGAGAGGCVQYVANNANTGNDYAMSGSSGNVYTAPSNVYAGVVSSNQVTFYGIPILPPTSAGVSRVFRMTNIRVNANAWGNGGLTNGINQVTQVLASISISGSTSVPVNNPVQIAGFVQQGMTTQVRNIGSAGTQGNVNLNQCSTQGVVTPFSILRYSEAFGTAFKTRTAAGVNLANQNIPGAIYNSESGFILYNAFGGTTQSTYAYAGLADYGTRLKAVFNNVPTGVRIFVSTTNVVNLTGLSGTGGLSNAQQVIGDTVTDGGISNITSLPLVPASGYTTISNSLTQLIGYSELSISPTGSATAIWEVTNTNPAVPESYDFGVFIAYTANPASNSPAPGAATVNMSFAPITPTGTTASGTLTIPRFADDSSAQPLFTIITCTTSLLFPFVTNQGGFDTGLALMNTTSDPFGTKPQAGTCTMNFYGQNAPTPYTTQSIPSGNNTASTTYAFLASSIAPNFQGYMIAICQFQLAHGYAFVSDLGAQKLAHGYIALVLTNNVASARPSTGANSGTTTEQLEN